MGLHEMVKQNNYHELQNLLNIIDIKSNIYRCLKAYNNSGESPLFLAMESDRKTLKNVSQIEDNKQEQNRENEPQQIDDLNINLIVDIDEKYDDNDNEIVIQQETLLNILHFMVYRIENDPKQFGDIITMNDEKYKKMKKLINEYNIQKSVQQKIEHKPINLLHQLL